MSIQKKHIAINKNDEPKLSLAQEHSDSCDNFTNLQNVVFMIGGMTCINCENKIRQSLENTDGVIEADVSYSTSKAIVTFDSELIAIKEIANIIWDDSEKNDILLVGHGSKKNSNKIYDVITEAVRNKSNKKVYLATLEGEKTLDLAIEEILKDDTKKLTLKSLFIIPGKHVIDDILNSNDSWSEKIKSKGIEITIGKKSLLQYEKIREMYITKINNVIRNIK